MYLIGAEAREKRVADKRKSLSKAQRLELEYVEKVRREIAMAEGTRKHQRYTQAMLDSMEYDKPKQNILVRILKCLFRIVRLKAA